MPSPLDDRAARPRFPPPFPCLPAGAAAPVASRARRRRRRTRLPARLYRRGACAALRPVWARRSSPTWGSTAASATATRSTSSPSPATAATTYVSCNFLPLEFFSVCGYGDAPVTCSELDCCCKRTCVLNRSSVDYGARELIFPWKSSRCVRYLEIDLGSSSSLGANRIVII